MCHVSQGKQPGLSMAPGWCGVRPAAVLARLGKCAGRSSVRWCPRGRVLPAKVLAKSSRRRATPAAALGESLLTGPTRLTYRLGSTREPRCARAVEVPLVNEALAAVTSMGESVFFATIVSLPLIHT